MMLGSQINENWGAWILAQVWDPLITSGIQGENRFKSQDNFHFILENCPTLVMTNISLVGKNINKIELVHVAMIIIPRNYESFCC